jgi:hypothetical protein
VNLEPPSVDAQYVRENVYAEHQQDRASTFGNEENSDDSNKPEPQLSFDQCLETIKQIIRNLVDGTEQSRFTPKQIGSLGFRVISKIYSFSNGLWIRLSGLTYPRSYQEYLHFPTKYKRALIF